MRSRKPQASSRVREQSLERQLRRQPGSQRRRFPICRWANRELQKSQVDFLELAAGYLIRRARHRVRCA